MSGDKRTTYSGWPILEIRELGDLLIDHLAVAAVDVIRATFRDTGRDLPEEQVFVSWKNRATNYFTHDGTVQRLIAPKPGDYRPPRDLSVTVPADVFQPQWAQYKLLIEDTMRVGLIITELRENVKTHITVKILPPTPGPKPKVYRMRRARLTLVSSSKRSSVFERTYKSL
jgi:hypothetical protein